MDELDHKKGWVLKNRCFQIVVPEKTESPLDSKEIKLVYFKGNKPPLFIGRTDEAPILWPPDAKSQLIGKDSNAGKDWRQEEKGMTEDEMVGWHHQLNEHEFEQALGDDEGQGSLVCCSPWGHKEWDTTEQLNDDTNPMFNILRNCYTIFPKCLQHFQFPSTIYDSSNSSKSSPISLIVFFYSTLVWHCISFWFAFP